MADFIEMITLFAGECEARPFAFVSSCVAISTVAWCERDREREREREGWSSCIVWENDRHTAQYYSYTRQIVEVQNSFVETVSQNAK